MAAVLDRVAGELEPVEALVFAPHHHVAGPHLRVGEHRGDVVDRTARQVLRFEPLEPRGDRLGAQSVLELDLQLEVMLGAQRVRGEPRIIRDLQATDITSVDGIPVTTVARTIKDCMKTGTDPYQLRAAIERAEADGTLRRRPAAELRAALDDRAAGSRARSNWASA